MDDEENIRETVGEMLISFGFEVLRAKNGTEVLEYEIEMRKAGHQIVLFVMDNIVPGGMGGIETTRILKERGTRGQIVLMSGYFVASKACGDLGVTGQLRLAKPFSSDELRHLLASLKL